MSRRLTRKQIAYGKVLRTLGFRKEWQSAWCVLYRKWDVHIFVHVQLWRTGESRVSHGHGGRENTLPRGFRTIRQMKIAIVQEFLCGGGH